MSTTEAEATTEEARIDTKIDAQQSIIAELCVGAPSKQVRDCIRKYDPTRQLYQIERSLKAEKKQVLLETLDYLEVPGMNKYRAERCAEEVVLRIQNLLPDMCHLCKTEYCIKLTDVPAISCVKCGQGCHNQCVLPLVNLNEEDLVGKSPSERDTLVNPNGAIGLFYVCGACQDTTIPSKEEGMLAQYKNDNNIETVVSDLRRETFDVESAALSEDASGVHQPPPPDEPTPPGAHHQPPPTSDEPTLSGAHNQPPHPSDEPTPHTPSHNPATQKQSTQPSRMLPQSNASLPGTTEQSNRVCRYYKRSRCKYGISGKKEGVGTCPFNHPKPCKKLIENGNHGPRGCDKGSACESFHPRMCHKSLRERTCIDNSCKFVHVKGTRRNALPVTFSDTTSINIIPNTNQPSAAAMSNSSIPQLMSLQCHPTSQAMPQSHDEPTSTSSQSNNPSNSTRHPEESTSFLEALIKLKEDILKEMELKLQQFQTYHPIQQPRMYLPYPVQHNPVYQRPSPNQYLYPHPIPPPQPEGPPLRLIQEAH